MVSAVRKGLGIALIVIGLDQASKTWIVDHIMQPPQTIEVTSFFNLVMGWNYGVSFGMFNQESPWNAWVLSAIAIVIVIVLLFWLRRADKGAVILALGLIIGGAFDEKNMLVYEGNVIGYQSDLFDESIGQGFNGAAWYHYFSDPGKTPFTTLGLGLYYFKVGDFDATDPKIALLVGGGYEFAKHWQTGVYFSFGQTEESGVDFEHWHLNFMISGIAF